MRSSSGKDQADRPEHFAHADEPQQEARQLDRPLHHLDRHDELHATREQKQRSQQPLNAPQRTWMSVSSVSSSVPPLLTHRTKGRQIDTSVCH